MRSHILLGFGLQLALSSANPHFGLRLNTSSSIFSQSSVSSASLQFNGMSASSNSSSSLTPSASSDSSSSILVSLSSIISTAATYSTSLGTSASLAFSASSEGSTSTSAGTSSLHIYSSSLPLSLSSLSSTQRSSFSSASLNTSSIKTLSESVSTLAAKSTTLINTSNQTSLASVNTTIKPSFCTGCLLEVLQPATYSFTDSPWTKVVVTQTVLTLTLAYADTTITETQTLDQTTTVTGSNNQTVTATTPVFELPLDSVTLTLPSGPTYVVYTNIFGGLESDVASPAATPTPGRSILQTINTPEPTCNAQATLIPLDAFLPTRTEDYSYFIGTFTTSPPTNYPPYDSVALPPALIEFLKQEPGIKSFFEGSDIATCTAESSGSTESPSAPPPPTSVSPPTSTELGSSFESFFSPSPSSQGQSRTPSPSPPPATSESSTYLSTSLISTSAYVSMSGCLRCSTPAKVPIAPSEVIPPSHAPEHSPGMGPSVEPSQNPQTPDLPAIIASVINDPAFTKPSNPSNQKPNNQNEQSHPGQSITIGDSVVLIHPAQETHPGGPKPQNPQNQQNPQNEQHPGVVIGDKTLTPGQVITTNGVVVSVPTNPGGSQVVVGGSTVNVNPLPTGPPILTFGAKTVTANSQGQFVIGTQTLIPGGPAITFDGSTLSLGPSGTVAVVNGVTQTLGNMPFTMGPPALTVGDRTVTPTVIGGSTMFVLSPGQTLTPGGVLTVDGTTFGLPADGSGSTVVINGVTSTMNNPGLPIITRSGQTITATVHDGTTEFVLGPEQTLTPGGTLVVDGTTFSMPADGSGSTVVVNGVTSTLNGPETPILTLNGHSITATVVGGTTEYILGPGQTLTPGGVLTVSGTTFSMPAYASGSVVVIDGVTSTLGQSTITSAPALTIDGKTYSATVRDGSTEYVLGPGTTLHPGEALTISGTTYSLDSKGTALVINGKTSTVPTTPASNSAKTTGSTSDSGRSVSSGTSFSSSSTTSERPPGNFIASGIGISSKKGAATALRQGGLDIWIEGVVIGAAGWLLMLL